jgi:hypothetical protein
MHWYKVSGVADYDMFFTIFCDIINLPVMINTLVRVTKILSAEHDDFFVKNLLNPPSPHTLMPWNGLALAHYVGCHLALP